MTTPADLVRQMQRFVGEAQAFPFRDDRAAAQRALLEELSPASAPAAIVMPTTVEQVQAVTKGAGAAGIAMSVLPNAAGNGANFAPPDKPSIALDLRRMQRVLEFDGNSGYALMEPGVSFDGLRAHIEREGAGYWVDTDTNGANSVVGSVAERAFGYTPYGDHLLMQCGMEVVTANGELLRTGMGALPGSDTWQLFKYNYGPYLDGLFSRSDLGIITKLGLWLMPAPPAYHPFMVSLPNASALNQAIETLRPLKIGMVVPNTVVISHRSGDAALLKAAGAEASAPHVSDELAEWNVYGALYGLADNVQFTWEMVHGAFSQIRGAGIFTMRQPPENPAWPLRVGLMRGEPAYRAVPDGSAGTLWFASSAPMEGAIAVAMQDILMDELSRGSVPFSYDFALTWRTMFARVAIPYAHSDLAERRATVLALIERLAAEGYATSHDCRLLTAAVGEAQTGAGLGKLQAALGRALDPTGIFGTRTA